MPPSRRAFWLALLLLALAAGPAFGGKGNGGGGEEPPPEPPPVQYQLTFLPVLGSNMDVRDMNEHGDLVGAYRKADSSLSTAFVYTAELGMVDLNLLLAPDSPWTLTAANAINNHGVIVASGRLPGDTVSRALRVQFNEAGELTVFDLGRFHPDDLPLSRGINDFGEICGLYVPAVGDNYLWYYSDQTGMIAVDLGVAAGNIYEPIGINNFGQMIGSIATTENVVYRVIPGQPAELFYPPYTASLYGGSIQVSTLYVDGMNDIGDFVGQAGFPESTKKNSSIYEAAYRHDGVSFFELGEGAYSATGINNLGDVVGRSSSYVRGTSLKTDPGPHRQAFLFLEETQTVYDLDDALVGDPADLALWFQDETAPLDLRINDAGVIVGEFEVRDGGPTPIPFILTPVPQPAP